MEGEERREERVRDGKEILTLLYANMLYGGWIAQTNIVHTQSGDNRRVIPINCVDKGPKLTPLADSTYIIINV